jgi:hypothetical protein
MTKTKRPSQVVQMRPEREPGPGNLLQMPDRWVPAPPPVRQSKRSQTAASRILQLKVTLRDTKPPIWRRLLVAGNTSLFDLHRILQAAMGWYDSHLHEFEHKAQLYGESDPEWDLIRLSEHGTKLGALLKEPGDRMLYNYDFGDDWRHSIVLEELLSKEKGRTYPCVIKGRRACPQEDSGGPWGHQNNVEILRDPSHPEYEETVEWLAPGYDPEHFDVGFANAKLAQIFSTEPSP